MSEDSNCRRSPGVPMTPSVGSAQEIANRLVMSKVRGPGGLERAMREVESTYGVPYGLLWALRYRPPTDILLGAWTTLMTAYQCECARQRRLYDAELARTKAINDANNSILTRTAIAVAGEETA